MRVETIFFDKQGRLRSGWRFAIFVFGFLFVAVFLTAFVTVGFTAAGGIPGSPTFLAVFNAAILAAALLIGWLCNRYLEKLPFNALGASPTSGWLSRFAVGVVAGAVTLGLAVAIGIAFNGFSFTLNDIGWAAIGRTFFLSLGIFAISAASEEAVSRGYPMQTFFRSNLKVFGIFFMAALFASGHLGNPNASAFAWLNTFLAGVWFGVAYWKTGDLWFPFGMHLAWNWMQGAFFGIEVSGLTEITASPLLKEIDRGPAWLTGENYGIEGGIICTGALIASTIVIYLWPPLAHRDISDNCA
jgi:membrane protease YdiL (CAAX protease family)